MRQYKSQFDASDIKLQHVQILWRHGDRSPIHVPPNDRNDWTVWPQGLGQLSTVAQVSTKRLTLQRGMQQQMQLGQLIRNTYGGGSLISGTYKYHEVSHL